MIWARSGLDGDGVRAAMVRIGLGKAEHGLCAVLDGGVEAQWRRNDGVDWLLVIWVSGQRWYLLIDGTGLGGRWWS